MRSLFVLSLPRSLSTLIYGVTHPALGLRAPEWVLDGEILNVDRYSHYGGPQFDEGAKFTLPEREPERVRHMHAFLDEVTHEEGFAYKDVTQPFVLASWPGLARFRVLRIRRDVAEVADSMLGQQWLYPTTAGADRSLRLAFAWLRRLRGPHRALAARALHRFHRGRLEAAMLEGLLRAEAALDTIGAESVEYEDLVARESSLTTALEALYGDSLREEIRYRDAIFDRARRKVEKRRAGRRYHRLAELARSPGFRRRPEDAPTG